MANTTPRVPGNYWCFACGKCMGNRDSVLRHADPGRGCRRSGKNPRGYRWDSHPSCHVPSRPIPPGLLAPPTAWAPLQPPKHPHLLTPGWPAPGVGATAAVAPPAATAAPIALSLTAAQTPAAPIPAAPTPATLAPAVTFSSAPVLAAAVLPAPASTGPPLTTSQPAPLQPAAPLTAFHAATRSSNIKPITWRVRQGPGVRHRPIAPPRRRLAHVPQLTAIQELPHPPQARQESEETEVEMDESEEEMNESEEGLDEAEGEMVANFLVAMRRRRGQARTLQGGGWRQQI